MKYNVLLFYLLQKQGTDDVSKFSSHFWNTATQTKNKSWLWKTNTRKVTYIDHWFKYKIPFKYHFYFYVNLKTFYPYHVIAKNTARLHKTYPEGVYYPDSYLHGGCRDSEPLVKSISIMPERRKTMKKNNSFYDLSSSPKEFRQLPHFVAKPRLDVFVSVDSFTTKNEFSIWPNWYTISLHISRRA